MVKLSQETHKGLKEFKAKHDFKSLDEAVKYLLKVNEVKPEEKKEGV